MRARSQIGAEEVCRVLFSWLVGNKLKSSDARARRAAVERLAADGARSVGKIAPLATDPDAEVRLAVVQALARAPEIEAMQAVLGMLADADEAVRRASLQAALQYDAAAFSAVRETHCAALVATTLRAARGDNALLELLARLGKDDAIEPLIGLLADPSATTRAAAVRALGMVMPRVGNEPRAVIVAAVRPLLGDADFGVQMSAAQMLASRSDDSRARNLLLEFAHAGTAAQEGVLSGATADVPMAVRLDAIRGLGHLDDAATRAVLLAILRDDDPAVRGAACEALGVSGDARTADVLRRLQMNDADPAVKEKAKFAIMEIRERTRGVGEPASAQQPPED